MIPLDEKNDFAMALAEVLGKALALEGNGSIHHDGAAFRDSSAFMVQVFLMWRLCVGTFGTIGTVLFYKLSISWKQWMVDGQIYK